MWIKKYKCPCCNYYTLLGVAFEICHVCFWENSGIINPDVDDGVNGMSLNEARKNYREIGAVSKECLNCVTMPEEYERKEENENDIEVEVQWPSKEMLLERLHLVLNGEIGRTAISLWAEDVLAMDIRPNNEKIRKVLCQMVDLDDFEEDEIVDYSDVYDIISMLL